MPSGEVRRTVKPKFDATVKCSSCEYLLRKVNCARLHTLLAQAWAELRQKQSTAETQAQNAAVELEHAFRELEVHWRESHGMNC